MQEWCWPVVSPTSQVPDVGSDVAVLGGTLAAQLMYLAVDFRHTIHIATGKQIPDSQAPTIGHEFSCPKGGIIIVLCGD